MLAGIVATVLAVGVLLLGYWSTQVISESDDDDEHGATTAAPTVPSSSPASGS
jgi:hypothetical protein